MSNEEIAQRIIAKIDLVLLAYLPTPDCPRRRDQNEWNKQQVKKMVAERLNPGHEGLSIKIEL